MDYSQAISTYNGKRLSITTIYEAGRPPRCWKIELSEKGNNYTLYTSHIDLIERVRTGDKQARGELERMTRTTEPNKRILIPILAITTLYLLSYTNQCNTAQNIGFIVGLLALIGLGIMIYKYSK